MGKETWSHFCFPCRCLGQGPVFLNKVGTPLPPNSPHLRHALANGGRGYHLAAPLPLASDCTTCSLAPALRIERGGLRVQGGAGWPETVASLLYCQKLKWCSPKSNLA